MELVALSYILCSCPLNQKDYNWLFRYNPYNLLRGNKTETKQTKYSEFTIHKLMTKSWHRFRIRKLHLENQNRKIYYSLNSSKRLRSLHILTQLSWRWNAYFYISLQIIWWPKKWSVDEISYSWILIIMKKYYFFSIMLIHIYVDRLLALFFKPLKKEQITYC